METASLVAKLGLNTSEFRAGLKDSVDQTKAFERSWKDMGKVFAAGGITTAVLSFFVSLVEHARNAKGEITDSIRSVRGLGDATSEIIDSWKDKWVYVFGIFTRMGESIGLLIQALADGFSRFWTRIQNADFKGAFAGFSEAINKAIDDQEKLEQTQKALEDMQAKIAKEGKQRAVEAKNQRDEHKRQIEEIAKAAKEADDAAKKAAAEESKRDRARSLERNDYLELLKLEKKGVDNLVGAERVRYDQLQLISQQKQRQAEIDELLADGTAKLTDEDNKRLTELGRQKDELEKQIALKQQLIDAASNQATAENNVAAEIKEQNEQLIIGLQIRGRYNEDVSDRILEDKIRTIREDIANRRTSARQSAYNTYDPFLSFQEQQLKAAESELQARRDIRKQVGQFGESGAARFYQGNMVEFERLLEFVKASPEQKAIRQELQDVNERLRRGGFEKW